MWEVGQSSLTDYGVARAPPQMPHNVSHNLRTWLQFLAGNPS